MRKTRIEETLRHLLAQRGVEAEFIVVDDRSTDRTGAILKQLAKADARVRIQRVDVLPEGWLGKCHACCVGANAATGDWILFTDADCWLRPDVIARAVRVAERERADHVTMAAGTLLGSSAARAWYLLFLTGLTGWFSGVLGHGPTLQHAVLLLPKVEVVRARLMLVNDEASPHNPAPAWRRRRSTEGVSLQHATAEDASAQSTSALEPGFGLLMGEGTIHPIAGATFLDAGKTHALDFELTADERVQIDAFGEDIAARHAG